MLCGSLPDSHLEFLEFMHLYEIMQFIHLCKFLLLSCDPSALAHPCKWHTHAAKHKVKAIALHRHASSQQDKKRAHPIPVQT
jgi:hypothetical protein